MTSGKTISGSKLHELREKKLISAHEISMKTGLHAGTINNIEKHEVSNVRLGTLKKLADVFGMQPEEFLEAVAPKG